MKKIIPLLVIGLMLAVSARAAENKSDLVFKIGSKTVLLKAQVEATDICDVLIDGTKVQTNYFGKNNSDLSISCFKNDSKIYTTSVKNWIAVYNPAPQMEGTAQDWIYIKLDKNQSFRVQQYTDTNAAFNSEQNLWVEDVNILDFIAENGCGVGVTDEKQANKIKPYFSGFQVNQGNLQNVLVYKTNTKSSLKCVYSKLSELDNGRLVFVNGTNKKILGVGSDMNLVYFSATGKGWTAYYAYDIKANKITKTTLAKINKDKIKLTLVKKF